jgi:hypothetical protein
MIGVEVQVAEGVDEVAGLQSANLRDHQRKECITGDIEGFCHITPHCYHPVHREWACFEKTDDEVGSFG